MAKQSRPNKATLITVVAVGLLIDFIVISLVVSGRLSGSTAVPLLLVVMFIAMLPIILGGARAKK
jgi:hypothetical protein